MFIAALFTVAKIRKQPKSLSADEWKKYLWDIYTMEYYSDTQKKKMFLFETVWMDLENIMLSEKSQSQKNKYHMVSLKCGVQLTNCTKKQNGDGLTDGEQDDSQWGW